MYVRKSVIHGERRNADTGVRTQFRACSDYVRISTHDLWCPTILLWNNKRKNYQKCAGSGDAAIYDSTVHISFVYIRTFAVENSVSPKTNSNTNWRERVMARPHSEEGKVANTGYEVYSWTEPERGPIARMHNRYSIQ